MNQTKFAKSINYIKQFKHELNDARVQINKKVGCKIAMKKVCQNFYIPIRFNITPSSMYTSQDVDKIFKNNIKNQEYTT